MIKNENLLNAVNCQHSAGDESKGTHQLYLEKKFLYRLSNSTLHHFNSTSGISADCIKSNPRQLAASQNRTEAKQS